MGQQTAVGLCMSLICCRRLDTLEYTRAQTGQERGVRQLALLLALIFDLEPLEVSDCDELAEPSMSIVPLSNQTSSSERIRKFQFYKFLHNL